MKTRLLLLCATVLAALTVQGCASQAPPTLLVLPLPLPRPEAARPHEVTTAAGQPGRLIIVRRMSIPEYAQAPAVRYRAGDSTVGQWPNVQWAERLSVALSQALALRLRQALPSWQVCDGACAGASQALVLTVEASTLDHLRAQGQLRADVHWRLRAADPAHPWLASGGGEHVLGVDADRPEAQARALGRLLDTLSVEIAHSVP